MAKHNHIIMPKNHMDNLYYSTNPMVRYIHNRRLEIVVDMIPAVGRLHILDAGCGEGHLIERLYNNNMDNSYYGVDITSQALESAKKRCQYARLRLGNLLCLEFQDEYFDVVICTEVLEHVYEYEKVIHELFRVLKTAGYLIITFPNELNWTISRFLLGRRPIKVPDHVNSFDPGKISRLVKMSPISTICIPFMNTFAVSLGCAMKFEKR